MGSMVSLHGSNSGTGMSAEGDPRRLQPPQRPVDLRLGYSIRRTDIHMKAATEKGISHGATSACISA
jgi:hypothetical protein